MSEGNEKADFTQFFLSEIIIIHLIPHNPWPGNPIIINRTHPYGM